MPENKGKFVAEIVAGESVDEVFVLAEKSMGHKRDGNPFMNVTLADKSAQVKGVVWDNVPRLAAAAQAGDFVRVTAQAGEYRGGLQLVVKNMVRVPEEDVAPEDYLPSTTRNVDQMFDRLRAVTDSLGSKPLLDLMNAFWDDSEFVQLFKRAPAAKMMHHAYIGGLLEHTLSMVLLAEKVASHYGGVDRDLLMVGAILHDVGKLRELSYKHRLDYTDEGRLLSHITIGVEMVNEKIKSIPDFPQDKAALVKHMIISHHGSREFGSPEPPKTIEAVLLNYIDEIDSRVNAIREFVAEDDPNATWTPYHRLLGRHFYKGESNMPNDIPGRTNS